MNVENLINKWKKERPKQPKQSKRRMVVLHRRQLVALSFMLLVGVAGYLNWNFQKNAVDPDVAAVYSQVSKKIGEAQMVNSKPTDAPAPANAPENQSQDAGNDYFSQAKLERDIKRSESMDMLTEILNAQNSDKAARSKAEDDIHTLADYTEKEAMIENLIHAKGFENTVVFMGENLISIAVKSQGLNEIDAAILRDAAIDVTGYSAENIKIVEVK